MTPERQMTGKHYNNPSKNANEYEDDDSKESSGEDEGEENEEGTLQKAKQALTCRKVTLTTLMNDGIIEPGKGVLAIDYLGQRFEADLLANGKIKWHGSEQEFGTPSAWAMHCKRLVNTNNMKRSGCGWASVKYKGKKLDMWKSIWARKLNPIKSPHQLANAAAAANRSSTSSPTAAKPVTNTTETTACLKSGATTNSLSSQNSTSLQLNNDKKKNDNINSSNNATNSIAGCTSTNPLSLLPSSSPATPKSLSALLSSPFPQSATDNKSESHIAGIPRDEQGKQSNTRDMNLKIQNANSMEQLNSHHTSHPGESQPPSHPSPTASLLPPNTTQTPTTTNTAQILPPGSKRPNNCSNLSAPLPMPAKDWTGQTRTTHTDIVLRDRKRIRYSDLDMRTSDIDMNTLIQCENFEKHKKLQPFSVVISSNALLLMDFHCHLTRSEVAGYMGGHWDPVKQVLTIVQSYPVLCRFADKLQASVVEDEIRRRMRGSKLVVVGWYHSHPYCQPLPSIRDVDCQMAYQLQMRGAGSTYHPCVGFIEAPFNKQNNILQSFWVMPNLENPSSLNIPMSMAYSVRRDLSLTEDILIDMKLLSEFYSGAPDRVRFKEKWKDDVSFLEKIRASLASKLPEDQLNSGTFLDYMQQLLRDMK